MFAVTHETALLRGPTKLSYASDADLPGKRDEKGDPHDFGSVGIVKFLGLPFTQKLNSAHVERTLCFSVKDFHTLLAAYYSDLGKATIWFHAKQILP